jgi:hypothetical protein
VELYPPLPQYAFMAWCSVKHRDSFTFTFTLNVSQCKIISGFLANGLEGKECRT